MNMECLYQNFVNTTTIITASEGGTSSVANLFDRSTKYFGSGDASDATTTSIRIDFDSTLTVDRIVLENITFKSFSIYYNSNSANYFSLTSACETQTTNWTTNSTTSLYLIVASATSVKSLFIVGTTTMSANGEKRVGELWVSGQQYQFDINPAAGDYDVRKFRKEYVHEMSDGGTVLYTVANKYRADIKRQYVSEDEHDDLETLHGIWDPFVFVVNPTGTDWDGRIYEVNWQGEFDFEKYRDNYRGNGYQGTMRLRETPN